MLLIVLIFIAVFALFIYLNKADTPQSDSKKNPESSPLDDFIAKIEAEAEADSYHNVAQIVAHTMFDIHLTLSGADNRYSYSSTALESITRKLLDVQEYIGDKHIFKSNRYEEIIGKYNSVAENYTIRKKSLNKDTLAISTSPDMQHCPTCLHDIGKEVGRARKCPKCGEKILICREIHDQYFLVNESQSTQIKKLWESVEQYTIPNIMEAFTFSKEVNTTLNELITVYNKEEELRKKAANLTIDF